MNAAPWPRENAERERLLHIDPASGRWFDTRIEELPGVLRSGDLLVVNDAATLPASLRGTTESGSRIEVRLLGAIGESTWRAALFGPGDWRMDTEQRDAPPDVKAGERIELPNGLTAIVACVSRFPRLVRLEIEGSEESILETIYAHGRPVQYAYLADDIELEAVQTSYASRPWAAEMPSAGRPLRWGLLLEARRRGIDLVSLTHAAGLSSIGDAELDAALPLAEPFEIPERTALAVGVTKARGGRVIAVGTTAVRALEGCVRVHGILKAGRGWTDLRIDPDFEPQVVDGLLTNMHERGESHFELLQAFVPADLLGRAIEHAESAGYLAHEFGDTCLILASGES